MVLGGTERERTLQFQAMWDDFTQGTKELLARRVGFRCSNPGCRKPTSGPQDDQRGSVNIGVAAHISAASPGGARFDRDMPPQSRASLDNGLWLCQNCAKLVDNDPLAYSVDILKAWRALAEATSKSEIERGITVAVDGRLSRAERDMPELIAEMRVDLKESPLARRFVCMKRGWIVWTDALRYYYDDHPDLDDKVRILQNLGLVTDSTRGTNIRYYLITEAFADYLKIDGRTPRPAAGGAAS